MADTPEDPPKKTWSSSEYRRRKAERDANRPASEQGQSGLHKAAEKMARDSQMVSNVFKQATDGLVKAKIDKARAEQARHKADIEEAISSALKKKDRHWFETAIGDARLWGLVAVIALAIAFSRRSANSDLAVWVLLVIAAILGVLIVNTHRTVRSGRHRRLLTGLAVAVATVLVIASGWWLTTPLAPAITSSALPSEETAALPMPVSQRLILRTIGTNDLVYIPEIKKYGIKVEMVLDNDTIPAVELQNISGQVWTEKKYLIATIKRTKLDHSWEKDRDRLRYHIWEPVLPKMTVEWLPTLVFALPQPGEKVAFGAEIVSKTTDFRQYRWWLANENGKGVLGGGDATPNMPEAPK